MLSTKSKFSLGLGCLVALLIAVLLVPPAVYAAAPTFEVQGVNSPITAATGFRTGETITITVKVDSTGDGPVQYDPPAAPTLVTLAVTVEGTARTFALRLNAAGDDIAAPFPDATTDTKGNLLFDYVVRADDTTSPATSPTGLVITTANAIVGFAQFKDSAGAPAPAANGTVTLLAAAPPALGALVDLAAVRIDTRNVANPVASFYPATPASVAYRAGDKIQVKVGFDNIAQGSSSAPLGLIVTGGVPSIMLEIGHPMASGTPSTIVSREAEYDAAASTAAIKLTGLIFSYEVKLGDGIDKDDGVSIKAGLALNGATIGSSSGGTTPTLTAGTELPTAQATAMAAVAPDSGRKVDAPDLGVPVEATLQLPAGALGADSFVVIAHDGATVSNTGLVSSFKTMTSLPNLDTFFNVNGGTIELVHSAVAAADKKAGPIITEIMWGTDLSQSDVKSSQWIEIFNADAAITDLSAYSLKITPFSFATSGFTADEKAVDAVGNLGDGKWNVPGQRGRSAPRAASTTAAASPPVTLISMRRKVDFTKAAADVNDGTLEGSWEASTAPALGIGANRIGTPGQKHVTQITAADTTSIPYSPVIINEIGNNTGTANDWIELKNVSDAEVNLKKWQLSVIVADSNDAGKDPDIKVLINFPDLDYKLGAGKILLIVNTSPRNSPLARGKKFGDATGQTTVGADQGQGGIQSDAMFYDAKGGLNDLPEDSKRFLLVLRSEAKTNHEKIIDITGTLFEEKTSLSTHIWPLRATKAGHTNVIDGVNDANGFAPGKVYKRNDAAGGFGEKDWGVVGYTGIGYDRSAAATAANGGTPGFPNGSLMDKTSATGFVGAVTISEIMVNTNNGRLPQWIELRNSSQTQGINLNGWQLKIEHKNDADADADSRKNFDDVDSRKNVTISLKAKYLPPSQTMLITTRSARKSEELTDTRVIILWEDNDGARKALEVQNSRFTMLSTEGFTLSLFEKDQNANADAPVDTVTISADMLTPEQIGKVGSERISLIRHHGTDIWRSAINTKEIDGIAADVYYGNTSDVGTPGWSPGDALPVSLSSFLPKRTDAGVVIKWTTQSELNNAGFNILRSATKTGEFVVINPTMIQGAGTTGEKHTYSFTDKTAKPNIVYYYQIEDVSFDGNRQRLTGATRLRGHIGAAGKLTTTWGDLKAQD